MGDETLTLTGELLEMDDDEIDLGERLDTGTELSVDNEDDYLPEETLGSAKGEIVTPRYPVSANEGDEIDVSAVVKNTGDDTYKVYVKLKNPEGKIIDTEPDVSIIGGVSLKPGETKTISLTTRGATKLQWKMPGYNWILSMELWKYDFWRADTLLHTRTFTVALDKPKEGGKIEYIKNYPASAQKGKNISVTAVVKNTGTKTSELRVYLQDVDTGRTMDKSPTPYKRVAPGGTVEIVSSTASNPLYSMPNRDWNLRLVLYDIDLLNWKDRLDERNFTVKAGGATPPVPPGPVCDEGEVVGDMICRGGVFVPITPPDDGPCSPEGAYDATGTKICSGGVWVTVGEEPGAGCTVEGAYSADGTQICRDGVWVSVGEEPEVPGVREYLTVAEADERVRAGLPCYIKCVLPILDLLPGLPYFVGCPILPGFAITEKP